MAGLAPAVGTGRAQAPNVTLGAGSALDITSPNNQMYDMTRQLEKETAMEQLSDVVEQEMEIRREAKRDIASITAPTARAGYLVAGIVGLLLFWFLTTVVFNGNKIATGGLIIATAMFFLVMLKKTIEKKGARYIAGTGGIALGIA